MRIAVSGQLGSQAFRRGAVYLKKALGLASPLEIFALWSVAGLPCALPVWLLLRRKGGGNRKILRENFCDVLASVLFFGIMQAATLFVFSMMLVGYSLAVFQLSALVHVLLGWYRYKEKDIVRRFAGAVVMALGAAAVIVD